MKRPKFLLTAIVIVLILSFTISTVRADVQPAGGDAVATYGAPAPISPVGYVFTTLPEFRFSELPGATNYKIVVYNTNTLEKLYTSSGFNCASGECTLTPGVALKNANFNGKNGHYFWKVKAYLAGSWQPYSAKADFTVISTGLNSTFNGTMLKWKVVYGNWSVVLGDYLKTKGIIDTYSSVVQKELTVNNLVYEVKMKRDVYDDDDNYIYFYGDVNPLDEYYDWNSYYSFDFSTDGYYSIWKRLGGSWTMITDWTYSPWVNPGGWNTLTVWLGAPNIYFWMNGHYMGYVLDTTFDSGFVGIGMDRNSSIKSPLWVDYAKTYYTDVSPYAYPIGADGKVDPKTELTPSGITVESKTACPHQGR